MKIDFGGLGFPAKKEKQINKKDPQVLVSESMNGNLMTITKSLLAVIPFKENYIFNNKDEYFWIQRLKMFLMQKKGLNQKVVLIKV